MEGAKEGLRDSAVFYARRLATLTAATVGLAAAFTLLLWGCFTMVEQRWNPPERRDAEKRCPWFEQAEVRIGGYGEPDWCVRTGSQGSVYGEWIIAGPYD